MPSSGDILCRSLTGIVLSICMASFLKAQSPSDPCGWPDTTHVFYKHAAAMNWGYGYDSLLADLGAWGQSPYVSIDSIGASVQNRMLFRLTVTDPLADPLTPRPRVWVHARTHPQEVEGTHVTNEMIRILLSDEEPGPTLRARYTFSIVPMYNPDGVELGYGRKNANGIDIESNWNSPVPEPEVVVLREQFEEFMSSFEPIRVALNMHSSIRGKRYFVYHSPVGTSERFAALEQTFIGYIRSHAAGRIAPWNYFISWSLGTPLQYPESWFWVNHAEAVMALTYEDIFGIGDGGFDSTALALLRGVDDYLQDPATGVEKALTIPEGFVLAQNYPNPFNGQTTIRFRIEESGPVSLVLYDLLGKEVMRLAHGTFHPGEYSRVVSSEGLASGAYMYRLQTRSAVQSRVLSLLR